MKNPKLPLRYTMRSAVAKKTLILILLFSADFYFFGTSILQKVSSEDEDVVELGDPEDICLDHPKWKMCQQREIPDVNPAIPLAVIEIHEDIDHDEHRTQARGEVDHDEHRTQASKGKGIEIRIR